MNRTLKLTALTILLCVVSCTGIVWTPDNMNEPASPDNPENPGSPSTPSSNEDPAYVWDMDAVPHITLTVPLEEWNALLRYYDANDKTKEYVKCDVRFEKGADVFNVKEAGMRIRGNTSRHRPEAGNGSHVSVNTDWNHFHIGLNFRKYYKDKEHKIKGINKMNLKWFNNDPSYVREPFCFDLFERAGVWTAAYESYCRLSIHVEGDAKPAYYGVYTMIEPYDNKYLERRVDKFGNATGNLWKCTWVQEPADLKAIDNYLFGQDDNVHEYTYELKETGSDFDTAKAQLVDFIRKLKGKEDQSFQQWIPTVCDVELLLRTYAVNVATGMWDDYWNNGNNYYLYFNSQDLYDYKVYMIPYDYDNTLGTSNCYDPATQNPLEWGGCGMLIKRLLDVPEYKKIYIDCLKELVNPQYGLMDYNSASSRIKSWQQKIGPYVRNDTNQDMEIQDKQAIWSIYNYPILGENGYLKRKAQTINNL